MGGRVRIGAVAGAMGAALLGGLPASAQQLDTVNTVPCAVEGGVCRMPYPTNVYFGVPGKTNGRPFPQGGVIACNVQSFGDPAPGQQKSCWYAPKASARRGGDDLRRGAERGGRDFDRDGRDGYRDGRDYDRGGRDYERGGRDYERSGRRSYDEDDRRDDRRRYRGDPDRY